MQDISGVDGFDPSERLTRSATADNIQQAQPPGCHRGTDLVEEILAVIVRELLRPNDLVTVWCQSTAPKQVFRASGLTGRSP